MIACEYPSIPHATVGSGGVGRADKIIPAGDLKKLLSGDAVVEEKVDGSNLGFSYDGGQLEIRHRGDLIRPESAHLYPRLRSWVAEREPGLRSLLGSQLTLFGEWCAARHSVGYNQLPDWLLVFDVCDATTDSFLTLAERDVLAAEGQLATVPRIAEGQFSIDDLRSLIGPSRIGSEDMEGIVVRGTIDDRPTRVKLVRTDFLQPEDRHWRSRAVTLNSLAHAPLPKP